MKKIKNNKTLVFVAILFIFVIGELAGYITIRTLFLNYQMKDLKPLAQRVAKDYVNGDDIRKNASHIIRIYDCDGNEIKLNNITDNLEENEMPQLVDKYLNRVIESKSIVSSIGKVDGLKSISLIIGTPICNGEKVTGVLFMLVPANEYSATLHGFAITYAVMIILGSLIIMILFIHYYRQKDTLNRIEKEYIANINHELKSPIASIKALAETLSDGVVEDEMIRQKYYQLICSESRRLENMVQDVLQLSKLQSKGKNLAKSKTTLQYILNPVQEKYNILCDEMGLRFALQIDDCIGDVDTNVEGVRQIINIFMDNAIKFVDEDGAIALKAKIRAKKVYLSVEDNGAGISEEALPHVFDRFYKEDKAHNSKGSGLGLSIAAKIAEELKEEIMVESELGHGAKFTITIKLV